MTDRRGAGWRVVLVAGATSILAAQASQAQAAPDTGAGSQTPAAAAAAQAKKGVGEVVVTASRVNLVGVAQTASQGSITQKEVELRPIFRIGQLFETVPGLIVTVHSGEGKANQYLLRGFSLDHGTDFASFVDGMPVNRPTNAHGQGYSDQNFLMPQLASGIDYTKGPYYAAVGDFGAVGSAHVRLTDDLKTQISASVGTLGDQDLFAGGTHHFGQSDRVWAAVDVGHLDGPWDPPNNFRKINAAMRYSHGQPADGFSLTGLFYKSSGLLSTDQPLRAIQQGLIGPYGTLDPTDGSRSERFSLSANYGVQAKAWNFTSNAYVIHSTMTLWNDFTHLLDDPVNGDQEQQDESRTTLGGAGALKLDSTLGLSSSQTTFGVQGRYDDVEVDRLHTKARVNLKSCNQAQPSGPALAYAVGLPACNDDRAHIGNIGLYAENTTHWTTWLRTIVGAREDLYLANDHSLNSGLKAAAHQWLFQPKGSLVIGPFHQTELYVSAGRGFHSDDVRGVFGTVPLEGIPVLAGATPLMAVATGEEVGLRTNIIPKLSIQVAAFREDFNSELAYNQDEGEDSPGAPSRRQGIELSGQYHPYPWIELNTDLAFSRARYRGDLAAFGLNEPFIANAPGFIGSFGVLVDNLGPWFGGLQWRKLGAYPINDGEALPRDRGYSEFNLDLGYKLNSTLNLQVGLYNLLDSHANASAYDYTSRIAGEPTEGVTGLQVHPLEPRSARFTLAATF